MASSSSASSSSASSSAAAAHLSDIKRDSASSASTAASGGGGGGAASRTPSMTAEQAEISRLRCVIQMIEGSIRCACCLNVWSVPSSLPCGHCFCGACLDKCADKSTHTFGHLRCPLCRKESTLAEISSLLQIASICHIIRAERGQVQLAMATLPPPPPPPSTKSRSRHASSPKRKRQRRKPAAAAAERKSSSSISNAASPEALHEQAVRMTRTLARTRRRGQQHYLAEYEDPSLGGFIKGSDESSSDGDSDSNNDERFMRSLADYGDDDKDEDYEPVRA